MNLTQHLKDRFFNTELHTAWLAPAEPCVSFPLWNLSGQLVGYQRYRPLANKQRKNDPREGRYFTRVKEKKVGVWGLESWYATDVLLVTEGVFDAARLTNAGWSAIAVLSYTLSDTTKSWLNIVRQQRKVIAVCDGDDSGKKLSKFAHDSIMLTDGKDVGDLTQGEFDELESVLRRRA